MKKILTILVAVAMTSAVLAKDYKHSVGMVAGSGIGVQYKTMIMSNFALIDEFGYLGCYAGGGSQMMGSYFGAIDQLVLAYQSKAAEGNGIRLDWYAGGQLKVGYVGQAGAFDAGVIGVGAAAGLEANMKNAPIAFSFDFRPGYACVLLPNKNVDHMFDWTFNLGVRYTF